MLSVKSGRIAISSLLKASVGLRNASSRGSFFQKGVVAKCGSAFFIWLRDSAVLAKGWRLIGDSIWTSA